MSKKNEKHYIDKDELWSVIDQYYKEDDKHREDGGEGIEPPRELGEMIMKIAHNIMTAQNLSGYPFKDQMEGDAILRMVMILTKRKFKLWSQDVAWNIKPVTFKGWKLTKKGEDILKDTPQAKFSCLPESKLSDSVMVMTPRENSFYEDDNGNMQPVYDKLKLERGLFELSEEENVTLGSVERDSKGKEVKVNVYDQYGKPIMVKNNAFGYLSLIATREAITRIKREKKNFNAIHEFQEQEFLNFLCDNPEMAPQRVVDDVYDID